MVYIMGKDVRYDEKTEEGVNEDYHIRGTGIGV